VRQYLKTKQKSEKTDSRLYFVYFLVFLIIFTVSTLASYTYFINEKEINYEEVMAKIDPENGIQVEIPGEPIRTTLQTSSGSTE